MNWRSESGRPLTLDEVLEDEHRMLGDDHPYSALCLSGGGIRSATFSLGVIQGLAKVGLLDKFDYLSTVSGGGYIGAWLSAWIARAGGIAGVMAELSKSPTVPPFEPEPVRHLRQHSTYLTEKTGPMFGGAWTWVTTYMWQLLVYWLILGLSATAVLFLPRLWFSLLSWHPATPGGSAAIVCAACAASAIFYVVTDLPGLGDRGLSQDRFVTLFLIPLFGFAYALTTWRIWTPRAIAVDLIGLARTSATVVTISVAFATLLVCLRSSSGRRFWRVIPSVKWLLLAAPLGALAGPLSWYLVSDFRPAILPFAPPILALMVFILAIVFPALIASGLPEDLEWMNIAGSAVFVSGLLLALVTWLNTIGVIPRPAAPLEEFERWAFLVALTLVLGRLINVNRISQQSSYRNRLIRAYLGASNRMRKPHPLTGMDAYDNIRLSDLAGQRPFHVMNMALNISQRAGGDRKTETFTMSPLHCGSVLLGFRPTKEYARGVSLGTAVGISGAAVEPGPVAGKKGWKRALLMLFNARLGMWLGNPGLAGRFSWRRGSPTFAISSLMQEIFGIATAKGPYVRLSDGGHFENLGLYEMVQRRCRYIVVVDAGEDKDYGFEDLYVAKAKIQSDFGVQIDLDPQGTHVTLGRIRYPYVDGPNAQDGVLVYIKPILTGDEPGEILHYARTHKYFPQQPTTDQWFDEAQFESYRSLGSHSIASVTREWPGGDFTDLFHYLLDHQPKAQAAAAGASAGGFVWPPRFPERVE